jgi:FixJ family two-component response regulator
VTVGIDETDADAAQEVRKTSDALLDAVRRLHDLEREKRAQQLSTPEFHAMAHEITERSREVFRLAAVEERAGDEVESQQEETTEDIRP